MSQHTERSVLDALRKRHAKNSGNGPEWAFIEHVRNAAGFQAKRTIDAMALHLWPSRGMELHGFEVKVSRSDFRREIADVAKMDAFADILDRFWIVAPKGIVPPDELPTTWGLLEVLDDGTIRQKKAAPLLTETRVAIPRTMLVPLLRAAGAVPEVDPVEVKEAYSRGFQDGADAAEKASGSWKSNYETASERLTEARQQVQEISEALGVNIAQGWSPDARKERLATVADAVRQALAGEEIQERVSTTLGQIDNILGRQEERIHELREMIAAEERGA